jgi:hypothetical protein
MSSEVFIVNKNSFKSNIKKIYTKVKPCLRKGRSRTGLPVAAKIAFNTAGPTTQMVGSPTPPQKS